MKRKNLDNKQYDEISRMKGIEQDSSNRNKNVEMGKENTFDEIVLTPNQGTKSNHNQSKKRTNEVEFAKELKPKNTTDQKKVDRNKKNNRKGNNANQN